LEKMTIPLRVRGFLKAAF